MNSQLAIDVGATGIKGALVDLDTGELVSDRIKYDTPSPAVPESVVETMAKIIRDHNWQDGPVGIGFPAIIKNNIALSASNIDESWINVDLKGLTKKILNLDSHSINDADAAGIAEMTFGHGKGVKGTVIMLTLGTGIGSGMFKDGELLPNTEMGRLIYKDSVAEHYASNSARKRLDLSWDEYGKALNEFLLYVHHILNPDMVILGGGISKKFEKYGDQLDPQMNVIKAKLQNNAGIIGAAMNVQKMASLS